MRETPREDLADYIRRERRSKHRSCLDISNRARQKGHAIHKSYIARLENRQADPRRAGNDKLTALAAGLDVPAPEIFAVARGESIDSVREASLLSMYRALPPASQEHSYLFIEYLYQRRTKPKKNHAGE